mgnify:CR=1 FL=1
MKESNCVNDFNPNDDRLKFTSSGTVTGLRNVIAGYHIDYCLECTVTGGPEDLKFTYPNVYFDQKKKCHGFLSGHDITKSHKYEDVLTDPQFFEYPETDFLSTAAKGDCTKTCGIYATDCSSALDPPDAVTYANAKIKAMVNIVKGYNLRICMKCTTSNQDYSHSHHFTINQEMFCKTYLHNKGHRTE